MTDGERLKIIYSALRERGYAPVNQIVGFILSGDPTYITNHNNARALIRKLDRDELLQASRISAPALFTSPEIPYPAASGDLPPADSRQPTAAGVRIVYEACGNQAH